MRFHALLNTTTMTYHSRPYYDVTIDKPIADKTEKEISEMFYRQYGWKTVSINKDFMYDLLLEKNGRKIKLEIKEDFTCYRTGNVGLEFHCRGRLSGISVSQASHYLFKVHTRKGLLYLLIKTERLKQMIEENKFHRIVTGGDPQSDSKSYLFSLGVMIKNSKKIFK